MLSFLSSRNARILSIALLLQALAFYGLGRTEPVRIVSALSTFPQEFGSWKLLQEGVVDKETMEVLKADDVVTRWYSSERDKDIASLFIAYFNTQRRGKTPHSPKNCLPGAGWTELRNDKLLIPIAGRPEPVEANRYVVARGNDKSMVIYWYQTKRRTIASEYTAKIYTVVDSLRYNRSDTAVVKVTVPIRDGNEEKANAIAVGFVQAMFDKLAPYFPA
ncbi:MAG TPA: EpsI family protein [Bryobacteraceae bacterium]|nr:EpsI family protein [Bryobacteraceae bacterium]